MSSAEGKDVPLIQKKSFTVEETLEIIRRHNPPQMANRECRRARSQLNILDNLFKDCSENECVDYENITDDEVADHCDEIDCDPTSIDRFIELTLETWDIACEYCIQKSTREKYQCALRYAQDLVLD